MPKLSWILHARMDSATPANTWRSSAAYLYILGLDSIALAWEYLRRHPAHIVEHATHRGDSPHASSSLASGEGASLALTPLTASQSAPSFSLWRIPGIKYLVPEGPIWSLTIEAEHRTWRLAISPDLRDGDPFAFQLAGGSDPCRFTSTISRINTWMAPRANRKAPCSARANRPDRNAVLHMKTLQALDADRAKASHRDIAEALYGADDVWQRWGKDSELRAHIRYLIRRGRGFADGGYRKLLSNF